LDKLKGKPWNFYFVPKLYQFGRTMLTFEKRICWNFETVWLIMNDYCASRGSTHIDGKALRLFESEN
jgi:hypothetical protein